MATSSRTLGYWMKNAIVLTTWHGSKGREWPVVAVCGLDRDIKARLPKVELGYSTFDELSRLLEHARIEYAPRIRCFGDQRSVSGRAPERRGNRGTTATVRRADTGQGQDDPGVAGLSWRKGQHQPIGRY